jgi:putative ABC transport system permease protein
MLFWTSLKVALKSLLANKLRSFLATLGIIIGVGAVISMLALAGGARKQIMDRVASMGTNLLIVSPGKGHSHGRSGGSRESLKIDDAIAIMAEVEGIAQMAPVAQGQGQIKYFNKNTQCAITGTTITYFPIRAFVIDKGRCFTELEAETMARVAVLGSVTAENLFGDNPALGETIKIKGINFVVVGVMKSKGDQGWSNPDDQAIVPYTTLMKQIAGVDSLREIDIQARDSQSLDKVLESITTVLRRRHRIQPGADDDFNVRNQAEILEVASDVTGTFTFLLGGIASISLLVGGIGIMNIMLVTVTERTREIGIRKAIGARDRDILLQFLFEALLLSGIGGFLGIAVGIGGAELIGRLTTFTPLVEPMSVALAFGVSASVGVFFGFYPAMRAAELDPIDALRYE